MYPTTYVVLSIKVCYLPKGCFFQSTYSTSIPSDIRVGQWFDVVPQAGGAELKRRQDDHRPAVRVCAFDIETTKLPLKFPDPAIDRVMMISYMLDDQGYLITNR